MKKDIYITSTLHHDWNLFFNSKLCQALESKNIACYSPQRDTDQNGQAEDKFRQNMAAIRGVKKLLCVAENESVNWGGEVGLAHGLEIKIIALKHKGHDIPLMLRYMIDEVVEVENLAEIDSYLQELVAKLQ